MNQRLERMLQVVKVLRVFAADAVAVGTTGDTPYWEGVRDGLSVVLAMVYVTGLVDDAGRGGQSEHSL